MADHTVSANLPLPGFSKNLREELKPYSIKVTCIYSGCSLYRFLGRQWCRPERIMKPSDIAIPIVQISKLSHQAVVEELVIRPLVGDL